MEPASLPPLPRPFAPEPRELRARAGCGRGALVGCGALILLFGIGAVVLATRATEVSVWLLRKLETQMTAQLRPEVTPLERERLGRAFDELYLAVERQQVDQDELGALQRHLFELAGKVESGGLSREQARELTAAVELAAGGAGADAPSPDADPPDP